MREKLRAARLTPPRCLRSCGKAKSWPEGRPNSWLPATRPSSTGPKAQANGDFQVRAFRDRRRKKERERAILAIVPPPFGSRNSLDRKTAQTHRSSSFHPTSGSPAGAGTRFCENRQTTWGLRLPSSAPSAAGVSAGAAAAGSPLGGSAFFLAGSQPTTVAPNAPTNRANMPSFFMVNTFPFRILSFDFGSA